MNVKRSRIPTKLLGALAVLAASLAVPASARAQIPATAYLYGVHETQVYHPPPAVINGTLVPDPFRNLILYAAYQRPSGGPLIYVRGFYDGDGAGGMVGTVWKIRFMPDEVGPWHMWWEFSDGSLADGPFTVSDSGIPGPARLDPANNKFLVDARGTRIDWRGYGIKHGAKALDAPPYGTGLQPQPVFTFEQNVITNGLIGGGYNAAYVTVPTGWRTANTQSPDYQLNGTCDPLGTQLDCPLWGNYNYYSLRAMHVFDHILNHLHQNRIWTIGWITFGLQQNWGTLKNATVYEPLIRYFVARYGAYYNYFMWSPTWETFDLSGYVNDVQAMMTYLNSIDPGYRDPAGTHRRRLQGAHDEVQLAWAGWQTVQPRQHPVQTRTIFDGNTRRIGIYYDATTGINPRPQWPTAPAINQDYPYVIFGAETLWEFCNGAFGKPRNAEEVRRGLIGELFAGVLPIYDEWFEDAAHGPCDPDGPGPLIGLGNGQGDGIVQWLLNWWYTTVNYRNPNFQMLNQLTGAGQILSGIPGQQYVLYRQGGGSNNIIINLNGVPGVFNFWAIDAVNGGVPATGSIPGNQLINMPSPFPSDTLVLLNKQ